MSGGVLENRRANFFLCLSSKVYFVVIAMFFASVLGAAPIRALTIEQRVGGYADSGGLTRQRIGYDLGWDSKASSANAALSGQSVGLTLLRDQYMRTSIVEDEYARRFYGSGYRVLQTANLTATQTWARLSETRQLLTFASDGVVTFRGGGGGGSLWLFHETLRVGVDFLRMTVMQPEYRILDFDSQEIGTPPLVTSSGATFSVRHLATPTTMIDYTAQGIWADNRPPTSSWGMSVRQFVPFLNGAIHGGGIRAINRGALSVDTTYGQVDAWILDGAYLQSFGRHTHAKVGYRYYREDETTRVYADQLTVGTDRFVVAFSHDLQKGVVENIPYPLAIEGAISRYLTNTQLVARSFEVGVTGRF
jgi:hypothetical protein